MLEIFHINHRLSVQFLFSIHNSSHIIASQKCIKVPREIIFLSIHHIIVIISILLYFMCFESRTCLNWEATMETVGKERKEKTFLVNLK